MTPSLRSGKPSASIRTTTTPTTASATHLAIQVEWTRPWPASARRSNSIRETPTPTTTSAACFPGRAARTSLAAYREAIRLKPDYYQAHFNLGIALQDKGLVDEGFVYLNKAIDLKPDDAWIGSTGEKPIAAWGNSTGPSPTTRKPSD